MTMKKRILTLLCALFALSLTFTAKNNDELSFFMTTPAYSGNQEIAKFPLMKTGGALPTIGTVTGTRVNLRAEPSVSSAVVLRFEGGESELRYEPRPQHLNSFGVVHGGATMALLARSCAALLQTTALVPLAGRLDTVTVPVSDAAPAEATLGAPRATDQPLRSTPAWLV